MVGGGKIFCDSLGQAASKALGTMGRSWVLCMERYMGCIYCYSVAFDREMGIDGSLKLCIPKRACFFFL